MLESGWKFLDIIWAGVLGLIGVIYKFTHKRIDAVEKLSATLATTEHLNHVEAGRRAQVEELARSTEAYRAATERRIASIEEASVRTEARLNAMDERSSDRHIELLNAIHAMRDK